MDLQTLHAHHAFERSVVCILAGGLVRATSLAVFLLSYNIVLASFDALERVDLLFAFEQGLLDLLGLRHLFFQLLVEAHDLSG